TTKLNASGLSVGLPEGQMGNSEVGHLTLGSGRVILQELTRISKVIETGEFYENRVLKNTISLVKGRGAALHLMGLVSDGGVHSHIDHLYAILTMAKRSGLKEVYIHAFMDGRDTPPQSGKGYIEELAAFIEREKVGTIATVSGRYYGMDRDNRWDRVEKAYRAMVYGDGKVADGPVEAVETAYERGETDEFILPTVIKSNGGGTAAVKDGDGILFFNFRSDRARELTRAFTKEGFDGFMIEHRPALSTYVCLTEYDADSQLPVVFPPQDLDNILGAVLSERGVSQFRTAETEKYPHVTFFFNGGIEEAYKGENRLLIPSPKEVATYDLKPEMSACEVTDKLVDRIDTGPDRFILINYANGDMVGHTGILEAAVSACETVDASIGRVVEAAQSRGWTILITADHGNSEQMIDYDTGEPHTAHTTNSVPFILVDDALKGSRLREGGLSDVAPTILDLMELEKPKEMTGESLIEKS
ncbi:MAG: 2,3-bisphosphoglycerate-independent phosphoglycerate mutase, partial [Thermodesulfobacteriota bacterium]